MVNTCRYRLYPTEEQRADLSQASGCVRYVYNQCLAYRSKAYKRRHESKNYSDTVQLLNLLKASKEWLRKTYSQSLQMSLRNLDAAFRNFFENPRQFHYPKFKKKGGRQTIQYPQGCKADFQKQQLYLPKLGWIGCVFHRRFKGKIKTVAVAIEPSGKYYASILVDDGSDDTVTAQPVSSEDDVLGVDMGVKKRAACSDGTSYDNNKHLKKSEKRLAKEQRELARKKPGSRNRNKQRIKVAGVQEKIANQRKDDIEKATAGIAGKSHAAVAAETLNIDGMKHNPKLAKAVSDAAMGMFQRRLEKKCIDNGKKFVKIDQWYASSLTCSVCGNKNEEVRDLSVREWECPVCHTHHDRDVNASVNIAREGYRLIARLPMDCGEVKPVETGALQQCDKASAATLDEEAGRVPGKTKVPEAPGL